MTYNGFNRGRRTRYLVGLDGPRMAVMAFNDFVKKGTMCGVYATVDVLKLGLGY